MAPASMEACRSIYPDAYVWSQRDDASPSGRAYWVATGFGGRRELISKGKSAKGAWRSLRNRIQSRVAVMNRDECDPEGQLQEIFDSYHDHASISFSKKGCLVIAWSEKGRGFGEYTFYQDRRGKWVIHNECDGREAVKRVLCRLVETLPLDSPAPKPPSPKRSRR